MKPQKVLDYVVTQDQKELVLYQRGDTFQIDVDGHDLMTSRVHGSEEELATLALAALGDRHRQAGLKILVGGLGMGFTLRAVLDRLDELRLPSKVAVEVAEVFQAVVDWNVSYLGQLAGHPMQDERVAVTVGDVGDCFQAPDPLYDIVLLDVDNGPAAMTLESNHELYSPRGLRSIHRALAPGGVLAIWSSFPDDRFAHRFRQAGFDVDTIRVRERPPVAGRKGKGQRNWVFLGKKVRSPHSQDSKLSR